MMESESSRRDFMKKAAYAAPVVLSMNLSLAQARAGSGMPPIDPDPDPQGDPGSDSGGGNTGGQNGDTCGRPWWWWCLFRR